MDVLVSLVTNEVAMELQLLAEIANDIFGTGQVFSAGRKLDTTQRDSRKRRKGVAGPDMLVLQWCVCVYVCVIVLLYL